MGPELNIAPPSQITQTPGNFQSSFPAQTPGRKKANNQILSNFKQIDAREVKVHMWNLIENDDLLPRCGRPKNCDTKVVYCGKTLSSNYKDETKREEVKKFSDLRRELPKDLRKTKSRDL